VTDRGPGIPEKERERMFVPFQRLGDTDNTTGVGLGLALSRGLTEAMGGDLTAEDTPGGGLTMVLSLPAAPEEISHTERPFQHLPASTFLSSPGTRPGLSAVLDPQALADPAAPDVAAGSES
jgi:two-component system sensor histidine kinase KdpD